MKLKAKIVKSDAMKRLNEMIKNSQGIDQLWTRKLKVIYQNYQFKRWKAQGAIDGMSGWKPLDTDYSKRKKRDTAARNSGNFILIYHGTLIESVVGKDLYGAGGESYYREKVDSNKVTISTVVPYARKMDKERTFTRYGKEFTERFKKEITQHLKKVNK